MFPQPKTIASIMLKQSNTFMILYILHHNPAIVNLNIVYLYVERQLQMKCVI